MRATESAVNNLAAQLAGRSPDDAASSLRPGPTTAFSTERAGLSPEKIGGQPRKPKMKTLRHYLAGLSATFAGALGTEITGSMLPLALGASVTLMCTVPVVRSLWNRRRS